MIFWQCKSYLRKCQIKITPDYYFRFRDYDKILYSQQKKSENPYSYRKAKESISEIDIKIWDFKQKIELK